MFGGCVHPEKLRWLEYDHDRELNSPNKEIWRAKGRLGQVVNKQAFMDHYYMTSTHPNMFSSALIVVYGPD